MIAYLFDLSFRHWQAILMSAVPMLMNMGVLIYILYTLPRNRLTRMFTLIVLNMMIWQSLDTLIRMSNTIDTAHSWNKLLWFSVIVMGPIGLHFTLIYTKNKVAKSSILLAAIYFPVLVFQCLKTAGISDSNLVPDPFFGFITGSSENVVNNLEIICVSLFSLTCLIIMLDYLTRIWKEKLMRTSTILITIGYSVPIIFGIITQAILPLMHLTEWPLTSSFMTVLSITAFLALQRHKMFEFNPEHAMSQIIGTMREGVCIVNDRDQIIFTNDFFNDLLGYRKDELLGEPINAFIYRENDVEIIETAKDKRLRGFYDHYELEFKTKTGDRIWASVSGSDIKSEKGVIVGTLGVVSDITRNKQIQLSREVGYKIAAQANNRSAADLGVLFKYIHQEISEIIYAENFYICFYDEMDQKLTFPYTRDSEMTKDNFADRKFSKGLTEHLISASEPMLLSRKEMEDLKAKGETLTIGKIAESLIGVPLISNNLIVGVLVAQSYDEQRLYSIEDLELMNFVSGQIAHVFERQKSERQLRESKGRYETLFEDSPISLWEEDFSKVKKYIDDLYTRGVKDIEQYLERNPGEVHKCISLIRINDVNKATLNLYGAKNKHHLISNFRNLLTPDATKIFKEQLVALCNKQFEVQTEGAAKTLGGLDIYTSFKLIVTPNHRDNWSKVLIAITDITEERKITEAFKLSNERIGDLVNSVEGIVYECDAESFAFDFVSKQAERILGYDVTQWTHNPTFWKDHMHEDDQDWVLKFCKISSQALSEYEFEFRMVNRKGQVVWLKDIVNVVKENGVVSKLRGIMFDITKIKFAQEALQSSEQKLKEKNKELNMFVYKASHDLKGPLSSVVGLTNLAQDAITSIDDAMHYFTLIKQSTTRLNVILDELTQLTQVTQSGHNKVVINVGNEVDLILGSLQHMEGYSNVKINKYISSEKRLFCDKMLIVSILQNLITNAIRYQDTTKKESFLNISYSDFGDGSVSILVEDNGQGIERAHLDKVFEMFFRGNLQSKGTGLGLYILKNAIEKLGGTTDLKSKHKVGTIFQITIPAEITTEEKEKKALK